MHSGTKWYLRGVKSFSSDSPFVEFLFSGSAVSLPATAGFGDGGSEKSNALWLTMVGLFEVLSSTISGERWNLRNTMSATEGVGGGGSFAGMGLRLRQRL